jgi:molybdopterin-binding protein
MRARFSVPFSTLGFGESRRELPPDLWQLPDPDAYLGFGKCINRAKVLILLVMPKLDPMLTARQASRILGISYPTIKQWILTGKLKTSKTPGGHHRIAESTLKPFLAKNSTKALMESRERYRRVSGRNQIAGKILSIRVEGLLAEVVISDGRNHITAIITANAVRELQLKKGDSAAALIKSTDVMIERLDDTA